jgi:glutamyl-tRNA synthetase
MDWGNAIITDIKTKTIAESATPIVTEMDATLNLLGDFKKTEKKIHWVADVAASLTPCTLTTFDHLITKDKLEDGDDVADFVNPDTVSYLEVIGDVNLRSMPTGEIIQFERKGYYRLDRPYDSETGQGGEFFLIPDGKTVNKYGTKKE